LRTGRGGLAYVLGSRAPLQLLCDAGDIGVVAEAAAPGSGLPTITIYERVPAGIGFSQRLFDLHDELLRAAAGMVRQCPCRGGCPACVGPLNQDQAPVLDPKALTLALLNAIVSED
jgi:DEAD/DEAH box helicase domain-containing protein